MLSDSFFFNYTATPEIYTYGHTLSLHDALPISDVSHMESRLAAVDRSLNAVVTEDGESAWQDLLVDDRPTPEESTILRVDARRRAGWIGARSEEHTSELQSLMRISYAVFCLKKKTQSMK